MKHNLYTLAIAVATTLALAGCSVISPSSQKSTKVSGAQATEITPSSPLPTGPATSAPAPEQSQPATAPSESATTKMDTPEASTPSSAVPAVPAESNPLILGGEWTIFQIGTVTIDRDEDMPYIIFEPSADRFYANNGCNTLNGDYKVDGSAVIFANILSTLRMCPDVEFESAINRIIADQAVIPFKISEVGNETYLDLLNSDNQSIMRLRRSNMQFINGQWDVESIAGVEHMEVPASIFFDLGELSLHGNTGCNIVNGTIYIDFRKPNAIDFSNMLTTRMACPFDAQQTAMLVALEETASAISDGNEKVLLLNADGKILMTLQKADTVYEY